MRILLFVVFYYLHSELFSLSVSTEQAWILTHFLESNATSAFFRSRYLQQWIERWLFVEKGHWKKALKSVRSSILSAVVRGIGSSTAE